LTEEFNKYLGYVRNLGFEDTPDYEYLRDLFTQALKNTGEVEDGEYDWMKLNNGKGWEAMKAHPSAAHVAHGVPNASARELHGQLQQRSSKQPMTHERLNADLPKPGAARQAGGSRQPQRRETGGYSQDTPPKRQSAADFRHPEGSTVGQFQHSQQNLQPRNSTMGQAAPAGTTQPAGARPDEPKQSAIQKFMKAVCCG